MENEEKLKLDRRKFLQLSAMSFSAFVFPQAIFGNFTESSKKAQPFPLEAVRLKNSPFLEAVNANLNYLHKLEPDRFLHNFRKHAGLKPKGEIYGGWESDTIAGHSLGHYLTACALIHAQTGDAECKNRADYIVKELLECQEFAKDGGYVAGFTRRKGDVIENGRVIFDEIKKSEIRSASFDLNGCWVPFYNWHKLFSGLFAANEHCGNKDALKVAIGLAEFIDGVFAKLDDEQVEKVLNCEHGGMNESFAELFARTKDERWLKLAQRIRHRKMLDPMFAKDDKLPNNHANTQIPKVIGLARIYELTDKPDYINAAEFFWQTVTTKYSYVIGGNSDREYFQSPNSISRYITEQTCESCNTYNMLKLTRHLFAENPRSEYFDYYERAHFNHMLAHQNPRSGAFAYMIPLMSGSAREWSSETNDFWCCVGSGMETHSKHGESIYWREGENNLLVNLFIPSTLDWRKKGAKFELSTDYPNAEEIVFAVSKIEKPTEFSVSMRIPYWAENPSLKINGKKTKITKQNGYAIIKRKWKTGDSISLNLPMKPRIEATQDNSKVIAILNGPIVLAADLGESSKPFNEIEPALVGSDLLASLVPVSTEKSAFRTKGTGRPNELVFKPFYSQWERRTAVYFKRFTDAEWSEQEKLFAAEKARLKDLESRTVDLIILGDENSEKEHALVSKISYPVSYRRRKGRDARSEGFFEFTAKTSEKPLTIRASYWGEERKRTFHISIDGKRFATETLNAEKPGEFIDRDYKIPPELTKDKTSIVVRFEPEKGNTAGPVFGCRIFTDEK